MLFNKRINALELNKIVAKYIYSNHSQSLPYYT